MNNEIGALIGFGAVAMIYLILFGIGITNYILTAIGLQTLAGRRRIANAWLAWLPIGNSWIIGSIADEYDGRNSLKRKWRLLLLILNSLVVVLAIMFIVSIFISAFSIIAMGFGPEPSVEEALEVMLPMYTFAIIMSVSSVAAQMCTFICLNKIFESTVPKRSVLYLLISMLLPLGSAICLMICRNKGYSNQITPATEAPEFLPEIVESEDIPYEEE